MGYKKKELLQAIQTLDKTNQIVKNMDAKVPEALEDVLSDCQSTAIKIGTYLETLGEIAEPIVRLLEDYCENVYQQSAQLHQAERCRKIAKKIQKQLTQISHAITYDLPADKKEILFLPYKAAMWDSLESVWIAAKNDENCNTYVVPIPYFIKRPDGSFGEMVYEGNEYPDYVPITSWQEYKLDVHRPDVTYIHNPYDECNHVTSVHPMYYTRELKKYTENLIYIPYFMGVNNRVEEHFCVMPGTLYADKVIVESEAVRKIYIDAFRKFEKENQCKGMFGNPEEKFLALGSPKLDRIARMKKEDVEIPEQWQKVIKNADNTEKKVVLYNTTISTVLRMEERALDKMESVLKLFRETREVALLWRPHPLLVSTLQSMRPQLLKRYLGIVDRYQKEGWGIYDETADVERAILISDAYYGDMSSVVELYRATGKPIMIQNCEVGTENGVA